MKFEKGQHQEIFLNVLLALTAAGIFFASEIFLPTNFVYAAIIFLIIISAFMIHRENKFTFLPLCVIFFMLGILRFQAVDNLPSNDISNFVGESINVSGTIRENPRIRLNADGSYSVRYVVDAEEIKSAQIKRKVVGGLNINANYKNESNIPTARIGDKITAYGNIKKPLNYSNPGQLDIVTMLKSEGITATLSTGKFGVDIEEIEGSIWIKFLRFMMEIREHYKNSMREIMSNQDAAAIFAMLFGGYEGLNQDLIESFRLTGIVHILSVSGSHMSLLAATVAWLCKYLKLNRRLTFLIGFTVIGAYTVLSGFLFQVIRAAFMGLLVFVAGTSKKYNQNSRRSLTIIAIILLIYQPLSLFHISFQLSFLATAGIIYFGSSLIHYFHTKNTHSYLAMSLSTTISAVVFCQPLIAWYFNQLAISSLLSNLIVIPIIEVIIILGLIAGTIGLMIPFVAKFIFLFDSLIFGAAYEINKTIANFPLSNIYFPTLNYFWSIFYYVFLILIVQKEINKKFLKIAGLILLIAIAFNGGEKISRPPTVEIHFIDVHQGDAALIITPHGHAMMIDTGGIREHFFDVGARVDVPYLHHYGITKLDYIFLTHAHEDHAAGAGSIIRLMEVENIITANEKKSEYAASMGISEKSPKLKNLRSANEGEIFEIDDVKIEVLFAPKSENILRGNEISNVYRLTFGNFSALFTGDLIKENEKIILENKIDIKSTLLKVGHHGSKTSSSEEFLEKVQPSYAVICVGANNNFGHPRQEVVELIEKIGAKIYRTDEDGAIIFSTDGNSIKISTAL